MPQVSVSATFIFVMCNKRQNEVKLQVATSTAVRALHY